MFIVWSSGEKYIKMLAYVVTDIVVLSLEQGGDFKTIKRTQAYGINKLMYQFKKGRR